MSPSRNGPQQPVTSQELDAWLLAASKQRAALHIQAAASWYSDERQEAFAAMSALLLQAFEQVRVVSEVLREERHAVRGKTIALHEHYAQLLEHSTTAMERLAQLIPPPHLQRGARPQASGSPSARRRGQGLPEAEVLDVSSLTQRRKEHSHDDPLRR